MYCEFCYQVYADEDESAVENGDGKVWIACEHGKCNRWNHEECELAYDDVNEKNSKAY